MRKLAILALLLSAITQALAQQVLPQVWEDQLNYWVEQNDGGDVGELVDEISALMDHPININDSAQLDELFFLTDRQRQALKGYILQYGALRSLNELRSVNGFDSLTIALMHPLTVVKPVEKDEQLTLDHILRHGRSKLIVGANRMIEEARGFRENTYEGDPFRLYWKYSFKYKDKIQLQLSGDKDPGEGFFIGSHKRGFDFYGGHLMVKNFGIVERAIIGQYRLQFGQGLTLWNGSGLWSIGENGFYRNAQEIVAASPFAEYGYLQGIATTFRTSSRTRLTTFYSNANRGATAADSTNVQSLYNSGYYRTATELAKKDAINEQLGGFNFNYRSSRLHLGSTFQMIWFDKEIEPQTYVYNSNAFRGHQNGNLGFDAAWRLRHFILFGEVSGSSNGGKAGMAGIQIPLINGGHWDVMYRNYEKNYQNLYASAWHAGPDCQNEEGVKMSLLMALPHDISAHLAIDMYRFPWMKYQTYAPSYGQEYRLGLTKIFSEDITASVNYRWKHFGRNGTEEGNHSYVMELADRRRLQLKATYTEGNWHGRTCVTFSWFDSEFEQLKKGMLISQQITYSAENGHWHFGGEMSLFDVSDYDAAIYWVESDMQYEYGTLMLNGKGMRGYLMMRYNIVDGLMVAVKYGITNYADRDVVGSGYAQTASSHRQTIKVQMSLAF